MTNKASKPKETLAPVNDVRFTVCAFIDLQGFSSHLEISGYDLRTAIGEQATARLQNLEDALRFVDSERVHRSHFHPVGLFVRRINDAIVLAMDIDDILLPPVGETISRGPRADVISQFFDESLDEEAFPAAYAARLAVAIEPVQRFLGLVARLHLFVQKREGSSFYPGAKTIVVTGFRKPFASASEPDDVLSANFALSNADVASKALHGPSFFVDNHLVELCSRTPFARNLLRFAHFDWHQRAFDCLSDEVSEVGPPPKAEVPKPIEATLFRRVYTFRRLNAAPVSYMQNLHGLQQHLDGSTAPNRSNRYCAHLFDAMRIGLSDLQIRSSSPPKSFLFSGTNDLEVDPAILEEFIASGQSPTQERARKARHLKELGLEGLDDNSELAKKLKELGEETITLKDMPRMELKELGDTLWALSEEHLNGLLPIISGDLGILDFPTG